MYSFEDSFKTGITMFWALLLAAIFESYRPEIEAELEKILGRKLTDDERLYLIRESFNKAQTDFHQEQFRQWFQRQDGRKTIHDFVWNG